MALKVTSLRPDGTFVRDNAKTLPEFPNLVQSGKNPVKRTTLEEDPIFSWAEILPLGSFQELLETPSPRQLPIADGTRQEIIVQENLHYPLTPVPMADYKVRDEGRKATLAIANQNARGKASEANAKNEMMNLWAMGLMAVVVAMTAVFAIIALSATLGDKTIPINEPVPVVKNIEEGPWHDSQYSIREFGLAATWLGARG